MMPLPIPTAVLDAAFVYGKEVTGYAREAQQAMRRFLAEQFPTTSPVAITRACNAARALLSACYAVGEACRNEAITYDEAERQLAVQCPGFSQETYADAVSYGMFISR